MLYVGCSSCPNIAPFVCTGLAMFHPAMPTEPSPMGPFCGFCGVLPPVFMCGMCGTVQRLFVPGMSAPPTPTFGGPQLVAAAMQAPAGKPPSRGAFQTLMVKIADTAGERIGADIGQSVSSLLGTL
jgi:hypothetical protein